jgi:hypothetical protein
MENVYLKFGKACQCLLLLLVICSQTQALGKTEDGFRQSIETSCRSLLEAEKFIELDRLITNYQNVVRKTPGGVSTVEVCFAGGLAAQQSSDGISPEDADVWDALEARAKRWMSADPASPFPYFYYAEVLSEHGWAYRGSGFVDTVNEKAWPLFHQYISRSTDVLLQHKTLLQGSPRWYQARIEQERFGAGERRVVQDLLMAGSKIFPDEISIYFAAADYYAPKWYGAPGDLDQLGRYAAKTSSATQGDSFYARIYYHVTIACGCTGKHYVQETAVDRQMLSRSIDDLLAHYPDPSNFGKYGRLACLYGDWSEVRKVLAISPPGVDSALWGGKDQLEQCKSWAMSGVAVH